MRLNMDCVRDVLLCVEKNTGPNRKCAFIDEGQMEAVCFAVGDEPEKIPRQQEELLKQGRYDCGTLFYHVGYCAKAGLIETERGTATYKIAATDLSVSGHEFISNIREDSNWKAVKESGKKAGTYALSVMMEAAKEYALRKVKELMP